MNRVFRLTVVPIALAACLAAGTALAVELATGARLGTNVQEISAALAADGYTVLKYEQERDDIEVYVVKDGRRLELELDPQSGRIVKIEDED